MLEPINYPRREAFAPAILFALAAQPAALFLLSAVSLAPSAPAPVKPVRTVTLVAPDLKPFLPKPQRVPPQSGGSARQEMAAKKEVSQPQPTIREAATPVQTSTLRNDLIRYRNDGLSLKSTFTFLVTINQDWLLFLRAFGAELVLSPLMPRPGSPVKVYSQENGTLADDYVPAGSVVRSVDGDVPIAGFSSVLRKATSEFGRQANVFVLYHPDIFWAMQGKAAAELRARHVDPDQVRVVQVRYVPVGSDYDIAVESIVSGKER